MPAAVLTRQSLGHSDQGHERDDTRISNSMMSAMHRVTLPPETKQLTPQGQVASTKATPNARVPSSHH